MEDEACRAALAAMGCDIIQGSLIGKPVPAAEIEALARRYEHGGQKMPPKAARG